MRLRDACRIMIYYDYIYICMIMPFLDSRFFSRIWRWCQDQKHFHYVCSKKYKSWTKILSLPLVLITKMGEKQNNLPFNDICHFFTGQVSVAAQERLEAQKFPRPVSVVQRAAAVVLGHVSGVQQSHPPDKIWVAVTKISLSHSLSIS